MSESERALSSQLYLREKSRVNASNREDVHELLNILQHQTGEDKPDMSNLGINGGQETFTFQELEEAVKKLKKLLLSFVDGFDLLRLRNYSRLDLLKLLDVAVGI